MAKVNHTKAANAAAARPYNRRMLRRRALPWFALALGCTPSAPPQPLAFTDVSDAVKLEFVAHCGTPEKRYIVEANGTGVAAFDADGDGDLDLLFAQGTTLEELNAGRGANATFLRNDGGKLTDATNEAGLGAVRGWWTAAIAGDVDGDGDVDVLVCGYLREVLWKNVTEKGGSPKFVDATKEARLADAGWSTGGCFFDADNDGDLDLYLVRYLELDPKNPPVGTVGTLHLPCTWRSHNVYCGPKGFVATPDRFFRNRGDGTFEEATADAGFADAPASYGLGICPIDYDLDGKMDLYVANDSKANFLWHNEGERFAECAYLSGAGLGDGGATYAGMGVAEGDADGDGLPDIVVTNFSDEPVSLYRNRGRDAFGAVTFDLVSTTAGLAAKTLATLKWGVDFADFDLDGDLDLFVANGHVYPEASLPNTGTSYEEPNQLFVNDGKGKFALHVPPAGSPLLVRRSHRAMILLDADDDGASDVLLVPVDGRAVLLHNDCPTPKEGGPARVRIELRGSNKNTEALGALVTVVADGKSFVRSVRRGGSYASSRDPRLCVGLGNAKKIDRIVVKWPGGAAETIPGEGLLGRAVTIEQGRGVVKKPLLRGAVE